MKRPASTQPDLTDFVDQALDHCQNIATLANLLRAAARPPGGEPLDELTVSNAAWQIGDQNRQLQELIRQWNQTLNKKPHS